jgi:hypothetical protein
MIREYYPYVNKKKSISLSVGIKIKYKKLLKKLIRLGEIF